MKVLITGAFGFVGRNLSAYLAARGNHLIALDVALVGNKLSATGNRESSREDAKAQKSGGDGTFSSLILYPSSLPYTRCYTWEQLEEIPWGEVDAVIHLAGKAHDTKNTSDPQSYFDVNVGLTKKVIESFSRQDAKMQRTFILFSSVKAAADRMEGVLAEDAVPSPSTPYGQSKLEAEHEVLKCGSSKVRESVTTNDANQVNGNNFRTSELSNLRTYILRPCMIHGPGNKGNLNLLYGIVRKGIPWPLGGFENRRSFASIGNVCAVVESLLKGEVQSGVYQVADDEPLSTNDLICLIAETLGRRARIWKVPAGWVRAVARLGDGLRLPLNSERLKKLTESYVVSNAKLKRALGWDKMPVSTREGMRTTLESFSR